VSDLFLEQRRILNQAHSIPIVKKRERKREKELEMNVEKT